MKVVRIGEVEAIPNTHPVMTGGPVTSQPIVTAEMARDFDCTQVNFSKGARNKFHEHTSDTILIITAGVGIVATETEERQVTVGDIIHIPPGERHWHGATKNAYMSHIGISGLGKTTTVND